MFYKILIPSLEKIKKNSEIVLFNDKINIGKIQFNNDNSLNLVINKNEKKNIKIDPNFLKQIGFIHIDVNLKLISFIIQTEFNKKEKYDFSITLNKIDFSYKKNFEQEDVTYFICYHDKSKLDSVIKNIPHYYLNLFEFVNLNECNVPKELIYKKENIENNRIIYSEYLALYNIKPATTIIGFFPYSIPIKFSKEWAKLINKQSLFLPEIKFENFINKKWDINKVYYAEKSRFNCGFKEEIEFLNNSEYGQKYDFNFKGCYKGSVICSRDKFEEFKNWFFNVSKMFKNKYKDTWLIGNFKLGRFAKLNKDKKDQSLTFKYRLGMGHLLERVFSYFFNDNRFILERIK